MGTKFPKYSELVNQAYGFAPITAFQTSDVTHNLCVGTYLFWVIQLCYNVHVK